MDKESQQGRILKELKKFKAKGVPNYRFPQMGILRYSSRITELRKDGHNIQAVRQYFNGHASHVFHYFLNEDN